MNHHELKEGTFELSVPVSEICGAPARVCSVCDAYEFNSAIAIVNMNFGFVQNV